MTAVAPRASTPCPEATSELVDVVELAHLEACAALGERGRGLLAAVTWLSMHLAGVERVVHPVAMRTLADGADRVSALRRSAHAMQHTLWLLEHRLTGDTRAAGASVERLVARLRDQLDEHAWGEHHLLAALATTLSLDEGRRLAASYAAATAHAPTRPHPFNPERRALRGIAFRFDAVVDRVRDLLDSRHVPVLEPKRPPRAQGPWARYLLGGAAPAPQADEVTD